MFRNDANRIGYIILFIILFFGTFCIYDLNRMLNLKSQIIGYFQHPTTSIKINDFEYNINQLLFTNSGTENEYFAEVKMNEIVTGFDKSKNYTLLVNDTQASRVNGNFGYVNVDFMNSFYSTNETLLLTDNLNIKINFYTDSTKIVFITQNGEQAVKLWTSFIQKNGLNLKIVEDKFNSSIEADNIPNYTINLYVEDMLYTTYNINSITQSDYTLPFVINGYIVSSWQDEDGNAYTDSILPLANTNLYAKLINTNRSCMVYSLSSENLFCYTIPEEYSLSSLSEYDDVYYPFVETYNTDIFELMTSSDVMDWSKLEVECSLNFNNHIFGNVGKYSQVSFLTDHSLIIKNAGNTKAYNIYSLVSYSTEEKKFSGFIFGSLYYFSDEAYPEESHFTLSNEEFEEFLEEIETSMENKTFNFDLRLVVYDSTEEVSDGNSSGGFGDGVVIVDPSKPNQPTIGYM